MKMIKKVITALLAITCSATIFAQTTTSGLYRGSAGTVKDDISGILDTLDWDIVNFKQFCFSADLLNTNHKIKVNGGLKLKNKDTLMFGYEGNLWADQTQNTVSVLYGTKNMGIKGSFNKGTYTFQTLTLEGTAFGGEFGMEVNKKFAFKLGTNYAFADLSYMDAKFSNIDISALGIINAKDAKGLKIDIPVAFAFDSAKLAYDAMDVTYKITDFVINPGLNLTYNIMKNTTYGLTANMPVTVTKFYDSDDAQIVVRFLINNGISTQIKKNLALSTGIQTSLPTITKQGDSKSTGSVSNTFLGAVAYNITPDVRFDVLAELPLADAVEPADIFYYFSVSFFVSAKF